MAIIFPNGPTEGQVHNVSPGVSFVYRGGAWVPAPMRTALPMNYLHNPAMLISQQNGTTQYTQGDTQDGGVAGTTTTYYVADQWAAQWAYSGMTATVGLRAYNSGTGFGCIDVITVGPN